jgi:hypothetical protein
MGDRCNECVGKLVESLGDLPTGAAVALLSDDQGSLTSAKDVVTLLNDLLRLDDRGITELVNARIRIGHDLTNHPTVYAHPGVDEDKDTLYLGILGIFNGMFPSRPGGGGAIRAVFDNDLCTGRVQEFLLSSEVETKEES